MSKIFASSAAKKHLQNWIIARDIDEKCGMYSKIKLRVNGKKRQKHRLFEGTKYPSDIGWVVQTCEYTKYQKFAQKTYLAE